MVPFLIFLIALFGFQYGLSIAVGTMLVVLAPQESITRRPQGISMPTVRLKPFSCVLQASSFADDTSRYCYGTMAGLWRSSSPCEANVRHEVCGQAKVLPLDRSRCIHCRQHPRVGGASHFRTLLCRDA